MTFQEIVTVTIPFMRNSVYFNFTMIQEVIFARQKIKDFQELKNTGKEVDQLISVKSKIADKTEIHEMKMDGDVMKMRALSSIDIPAGSVVSVIKGNPNGYHVMLLGLKKPLKEGDKFPLWLRFKKAGEVEVEVLVKAPEAAVKHEEHKH